MCSSARRWRHQPLALFAAVVLACGVVSGFSGSARADDLAGGHNSIVALRSYVQLVAAARPETAVQGTASGEIESYAALRAFAQRIGAEPLPSIKDQLKLAEADNLMDWLKQGAPAPAAAPPPVAAPRTTVGKAPGAVEATYIGSKVCLGCHSASAATYATTLMGRLQRTGKSLECETCHGPGSAHAKAGGGRGVGGIISFRANDLSRTAEENNAICLGCHERGERVYWEGSVHQVRGLACTNCHTIMRSVSAQFQLKTAFEPDTCFQCHKDRRAQMLQSSHMPMREGKVTCTNCHNPHGSITEALMSARFDQRQLLYLPRRKARTVPVRACAGARELPELPQSAWLDQRVLAENVAPEAVLRVPLDRPRRNNRYEFKLNDGSGLPELPPIYPWEQQSGWWRAST